MTDTYKLSHLELIESLDSDQEEHRVSRPHGEDRPSEQALHEDKRNKGYPYFVNRRLLNTSACHVKSN
jgi:hypothetical protein